ncbi:hypothetical protein ACIGW8_38750 [Streptomyces sioyaensis]|uniref:hypothetical protein n=1 Tax=Streptomyces sioyaensis TaxID=67364 RepID=UPI0037D94A00
MATTHTALSPSIVGIGDDQLQADIAAALRSRTTLPPYDEVLRLIDTLGVVFKCHAHIRSDARVTAAW